MCQNACPVIMSDAGGTLMAMDTAEVPSDVLGLPECTSSRTWDLPQVGGTW